MLMLPLLFCFYLHLASTRPLRIAQEGDFFQCVDNTTFLPITPASDVVWYRDEVEVTEVAEATIKGNTVTFHDQDPRFEAKWECELNDFKSQPVTAFSE